jgi:Tat protein secretion system quality control protein TatD with DNase activity
MSEGCIIDCHAHVHEGNFPPHSNNSLEVILENASKANVQIIVSVSEGIGDATQVLRLASQSQGRVKAGVGLHPIQTVSRNNESIERSVTKEDLEEFLPLLQKCIANHEICCVGEGIFNYNNSAFEL